MTKAAAVGAKQAAVDLRIPAHQFHSQYGTLNIGNVNGHAPYDKDSDRPTDTDLDFVPILTKTRRKIEDFNVVMANPTYEGHGFLNFVATYHDHTEYSKKIFFVVKNRSWEPLVAKINFLKNLVMTSL